MKNQLTVFSLVVLFLFGSSAHANVALTDYPNEIKGVWNLTGFDVDDGTGTVKLWCEGTTGTIMYFQNYMSVSMNCKSNPAKILFYSGPYQVEGDTVVHNVKNYSDLSLNRVLRRKISMADRNHLVLTGALGVGVTAIVTWKRR